MGFKNRLSYCTTNYNICIKNVPYLEFHNVKRKRLPFLCDTMLRHGLIGSRRFDRTYCLHLQASTGPKTYLIWSQYVPSKLRDPIIPRLGVTSSAIPLHWHKQKMEKILYLGTLNNIILRGNIASKFPFGSKIPGFIYNFYHDFSTVHFREMYWQQDQTNAWFSTACYFSKDRIIYT